MHRTRDKEGHYITLKGSNHQEDVIVCMHPVVEYMSNIKQILKEKKEYNNTRGFQ